MIEFGRQVERLRARQQFAARMHTRRDILAPRPDDHRLLPEFLAELDPVLDYDPDDLTGQALDGIRCPLPYGIRSVRYGLSPIVQAAIDSDGRVNGLLVRRAPETLAETIEFIAESCPVAEGHWPELRRLIYADPEEFGTMLFAVRGASETAFRLVLSREYQRAVNVCSALLDLPSNSLGFRGRLIDLCVTFGEMERCDSLGGGLAVREVDTKAVKHTLLDQTRMLAAMQAHSAEGEYLLSMLLNPALLPRNVAPGRVRYGPWNSPDPLKYDPLIEFADKDRYAAFLDDVLALPMFGVAKGKRAVNADLATYWGATLPQVAEITFIAAGDLVQMRRGAAVDHDTTTQGKGSREEAIRILADGFRARHDPAFQRTQSAKRGKKAAALRVADKAAGLESDGGAPTPIDVRLLNVGASRIQQNRDRAQLIAPQAGMPGHASAVDPLMWLHQRGDRALWQALCSPPPPREWLERKGFSAAAKRAIEALRGVWSSAPQLFKRRSRQDARLLAELATATGWLTGQPTFAARVKELVDQAPELRHAGWLRTRTGGRYGGGGDPNVDRRKTRNAGRIPHPDEVIRLPHQDGNDQPS